MASFFSGIGTQGPKKVLKKNKKGYDKGNERDSGAPPAREARACGRSSIAKEMW